MDEIGGVGSRLTFGGLATGLDTGALVDALIDAERRPLRLLETRRAELGSQKSALQTLNTRLLALRDAARAIDNRTTGLSGEAPTEELLAYRATSQNDQVVEAEAFEGAAPGSYSVRVLALAESARRVSTAYAAPDTSLTASGGSFTVDYGDGQQIALSVAAGTTLSELRDQINTSPDNDGGVRADLLFDGAGYRLVVAGTQAGLANDVSVTTDLAGGAFLDTQAGRDAADAQLEFLGVSVTRGSNEVTDLVPGVTLRLRGTTDPDDAGDTVQIDVSRDDEAIEAKLQAFVDAYNAVRDFSLEQSTINASTNRGGVLLGDPLVRNVERRLQQTLGGLFSFADNPLETLGQIGVRFDRDGRLSLDASELRGALDSDPQAVRQLLSGEGQDEDTVDGVATAVARALEPIVLAGEGLVAIRDDGLDDRIADLDRQIERFEDRLVLREESLIRQFSALESLVASLQGQGSFLTGLTSQLGGASGRS